MPILKSKALIAATPILTLLIGVAAGYLFARHQANTEILVSFYEDRAQTARSDAVLLTKLRSGDEEKAIKLLSGLLEGELISLGSYEQDIPPSEQSSKVY